ncbi:D-alanyl-D-alanine carboxypeptidase/D-alanyl-D-alanine endopeptidase [Tropicibacter oceani]|uniref:D-alanyl-D-alanine carboxypeptidase/D-alanyl-D-alanine-endopeptidase n=1 Tax=Tropicibacter oceani TaxID=3058420 RepID=A0ABY8QI27_9RHOB|nr:D-alanyl-D-alanine carboxypeptidase/D-alanyl-D-alanine-endopeptidase [Tropicibacter oceani]WGW04093.1 D-alanyl-D-alanine carboxypeptidase/D-alanyl-D-alanine-endopeptidase [Tropicibacter oceani]
MTKSISKRQFLGSALAFGGLAVASPVLAKAPLTSLRPMARGEDFRKRIQPPAEALIERANLGGKVSFCVADARTGLTLEDHMPALSQPPASVAKALTAAYALELLGPEHRFVTRVMATGGVSEGVVQGDLILAGGADPTLDTDTLAGLAAALKEAGITAVKGGFKVWGGALPFVARIDTEQPDHVSYSPAVSGLNLNYNRVHFEWKRAGQGYNVAMEGRSERHRPSVHFARMGVVPRSLPVYTYEDKAGRDEWTVAKGALGDGGARWLPVRKPELYAGEVFQTFAQAHGIKLAAPEIIKALPDSAELARTESAPLNDILRDMLKWSTNVTAEVVGMSATRARTGAMPGDLVASAQEMSLWAKERFGIQSMDFVDHSGLGEDNRISAPDMMAALLQLRSGSELKTLLKSFDLRDENRRVIKDHPIDVLAKTGTLNFVSGLAGFVDLPDGTELVFAIFAANMDRRAKLSIDERERPAGGSSWNVRAKTLQQALIERWSVLYSA